MKAKKVTRRLLILLAIFAAVIGFCYLVRPRDDINFAAMKGDLSRVAELLRADHKLADSKTFHDFTPLHWAALDGNVRMAQLLIPPLDASLALLLEVDGIPSSPFV